MSAEPVHLVGARIHRAGISWRELPGLRAPEVAAVLGISERKVRDLINKKELPAVRMFGVVLIPTHKLIAVLESNGILPASEPPRIAATAVEEREVVAFLDGRR